MKNWTGPEIFGDVTERFDAFLVKALAEEGKKTVMKKKQFAVIVLAAVLILALAATALAIGLSRSSHAEAVRVAKAAICQKYGFTPQTFGLFMERGGMSDEVIVFEGAGADPERLGIYTVTLKPGGEPVITWSHDGVDLAELAARGLDSPVWGAAQAEQALALQKTQQEKFAEMQAEKDWDDWSLEDRAAIDAETLKSGDAEGLNIVHILPGAEDIQVEQAIALAKDAVRKKYGATEQTLAAYKPQVQFYRWADEAEPTYDISLVAADGVQSHFSVRFFSPSGEIKQCRGFGFALPEGDLGKYKDAVAEFVRDGLFDKLPAAQKGDVGKRITAAGLGKLINNVQYVGLEGSALAEDAATQAAKQALLDFGFTEPTLALFDAAIALRRDGSEDVWTLTLKPNDERLQSIDPPDGARGETEIRARMGEYSVSVDPQSGKARPVLWSLAEKADGKSYTARDWATAPAIPVQALPFIITLSERYHAVYDPYMENWDGFATIEENNAMHAPFREAGFDAKIVPNGLPGQGDLTRGEALKIALAALTEEYGVAEKDLLENYVMCEEFDITDPEHPTWYFGPQNIDGWYGVVLDAKTGEILVVNYSTGGNG